MIAVVILSVLAYMATGSMISIGMSEAVLDDLAETPDARTALTALSVLLWPLWVPVGFCWLALGVGALWRGLRVVGRGLRDLSRQLRGRPAAQALPKARARRTRSK